MGPLRKHQDRPPADSRARPSRSDQRESERMLMERVREGDPASLRTLLERYWTPLVAYAFGLLDDRDVAEDVVQGTFIRIWNTRGSGPAPTAVKSYLYQVTRNLSLNARRDRSRRQRWHRQGASGEPEVAGGRTPAEDLAEETLRREVERAVARLSPRRREVFVLSRYHGLSHNEIAEALGTSPQTVANQVAAALDQLREDLASFMKES